MGVGVEVEQHWSKDADGGRELITTERDERMRGSPGPTVDAYSIIKTNSAKECWRCMDVQCRNVSSIFAM